MKKFLILIAFLFSVAFGYSQSRVNVIRVSSDSAVISNSNMPVGTLVLNTSVNTMYMLAELYEAGDALRDISTKVVISGLYGDSGNLYLATNVTPPVSIPKYLVVNPDGSTSYAAGSGGVDTLWLLSGTTLYNRSDVSTVKVNNADLWVTDQARIDGHIKNVTPLIAYDVPNPRIVIQNASDSSFYYMPLSSIGAGSYSGWQSDTVRGVVYLTDTTDYVGIGTTYPDESLDVVGNIKADTSKFDYYLGTTGISTSGDTIFVYTYGSTVTIDTVIVPVGLAPDSVLWVNSGDTTINRFDYPVRVETPVSFTGLRDESRIGYILGINYTGDGNVYPVQIPTLADTLMYSGGGVWTKDSTKNSVYLTHLTDKVGIGTNAPTEALQVKGHMALDSIDIKPTRYFLMWDSTDKSIVRMDTTGVGGASSSEWYREGNYITPINYSDTVLIGSSLAFMTPDAQLDINGTAHLRDSTTFGARTAFYDESLFYAWLTINSSPDDASGMGFSGQSSVQTAGEMLTTGDLCYMKSDGKLWKADASSSTTIPALWICTGDMLPGEAFPFLEKGYIYDPSWTWTVGHMLYLSTTSGAITQTAPSSGGEYIQPIGIATKSNVIYFTPSPIFTAVVP